MLRRFFYSTLFILLCLSTLEAQSNKNDKSLFVLPSILYKNVNQKKMNEWVDMQFNSMTLQEKIGQLIMPVIWPSTSSRDIEAAKKLVRETAIGGILYQKGFVGKQYEMNQILQSESKVPLLITLDGEWGLWMRLKDALRYPRSMALGHISDPRYLYWYGRQIAEQCHIMGINVNFAPDLDVNNNPDNPVIGTRSFGETPADVISSGLAYAAGLEDGGILSCAKHFPGHGNTNVDSHKSLPLISGSKKQLFDIELKPFQHYINAGYGSVMVGHLQVPALDSTPSTPSSMSYAIVTGLLTDQLHFGGLIFTDGMEMRAMQIPGEYQIGTRALKAGVDILLGPPGAQFITADVMRAINNGFITEEDIDRKCKNVLRYKYALIINQNNHSYKPGEIRKLVNQKRFADFCDKLWFHSIQVKSGIDYLPLENPDSTAIVQLGTRGQTDFGRQIKNAGYHHQFYYPIVSGKKEASLLEDLSKYNTVVVTLSTKYPEKFNPVLNTLLKDKRVVLCILNSPYIFNKLRLNRKPDVLVNAFEGCKEAQVACAKRITSPQMDFTLKLSPKDEKLFHQAMLRANIHYIPETDKTTPSDRFAPDYKNDISSFEFADNSDYKVAALNKKIEAIATGAIKNKAMPGCQIMAIHNGKVIYDNCFGNLDYENEKPVTKETLYDLASVTKAAATTPAVMLMIGDKKMSLNTKVKDLLPNFKKSAAGTLTVRELLLHRTGLPAGINFYTDLIDPSSYPYPLISFKQLPGYIQIDGNAWGYEFTKFKKELVSNKRSDVYTLSFAHNLWINKDFKEMMMKRIAKCRIPKRGTYLYSDLNFIILQQMVEKASGMPIDQLMEKRIYGPMNARIMYTPLLKGLTKENCSPAQIDNFIRKQTIQGTVDDESAACLGGISGNAGLYASAEELAKLLMLYRNHGKFGDKQLIDKQIFDTFVSTKDPNNSRFLGFDKQRNKNLNYIAKSASMNTYGHTGFTGTCFWIDPDKDLIFIFLSNRTYPQRMNKRLLSLRIRQKIHQAIYDTFGI